MNTPINGSDPNGDRPNKDTGHKDYEEIQQPRKNQEIHKEGKYTHASDYLNGLPYLQSAHFEKIPIDNPRTRNTLNLCKVEHARRRSVLYEETHS